MYNRQELDFVAAKGKRIVFCEVKKRKRSADFLYALSYKQQQRIDVYKRQPLYRKEVWDKIKALQFSGYHDAFRLLHPQAEGFTFWDYTANSFVTNSGLRIYYLFITAQFAEQLVTCGADKSLRSMDKPSDHTALVAEFGK